MASARFGGAGGLVVVSLDLSRLDRDEPKLFGHLTLCFVARGERPRLAGLQQRRNDDGCGCQMPGVHRTQRMLADELQGVLLNLVLWRTVG